MKIDKRKYLLVADYDEEYSIGVKKTCPSCKKFMSERTSEHEVMYRGGKPINVTGCVCKHCKNRVPTLVFVDNATGKEVDDNTVLGNAEEELTIGVFIDDSDEMEEANAVKDMTEVLSAKLEDE